MPGRTLEFIFRGNNRSVIRAMDQIASKSDKTTRTLARSSRESASSFDRMGRSTKTLQGGLSSLTGLVGLGGVAFGIKDVIQGGMKLQTQQAQLQAALRATGQDAGGTAGQLQRVAEGLSTKGGFTTPENLQALSAFIRETHSASQATSMLSLATNIARGRNLDLASAQKVVQRAYTGQVGRLQMLIGPMLAVKNAHNGLTDAHKREILQLQVQAKAMGKAGPEWLKQQEALRGITPQMKDLATLQDKHATALQFMAAAQRAFGGATAAYSNTTQGKLSNLKNATQNLTDNLGKALLPTVNKVADKFAKLASFFAKHQKLTKDLVIATGILAAAFGALKIMQGLAGMARALGLGLTATAAAEGEASVGATLFGLALDTIPLLAIIAGITILITHFSLVKKVAMDVWGWIKKNWPLLVGVLLLPFIGPIGIIVALFRRQLLGAAQSVWRWIKGNWPILLGVLLAPFTGGVSIIVAIFRKQILGAIVSVWNWIKGAATTVWNALTWPFRKAWDVISGIFKKIKGVFGSIVHGAGSVVSAMSFGLLHGGGVVKPKYFAMGGPAGNDTIPGWLSPGEGVVNPNGMRILGSRGLNALNHGQVPGGGDSGEMVTAPIQLRVDGQVLLNVMARAAARRAARGPSSLSGGSLATGVGSPVAGT